MAGWRLSLSDAKGDVGGSDLRKYLTWQPGIGMYIWGFPKIVGFPPKSSIFIEFSIIFTIHFGVPLFLETPICSMRHREAIVNNANLDEVLEQQLSIESKRPCDLEMLSSAIPQDVLPSIHVRCSFAVWSSSNVVVRHIPKAQGGPFRGLTIFRNFALFLTLMYIRITSDNKFENNEQ